ncbi:MAG TPA: hypothetical protein DEQ47_06100 [Solibacterales bacterium]|nr:hypothetical protein [Bryobacterales bacterium]
MKHSWKTLIARVSLVLVSVVLAYPADRTPAPRPGTLKGDITDPTGAAVAGAQIHLTGGNGLSRDIQSDSLGHFAAPALPPGGYTLTTAVPGFAEFAARDVQMGPGANVNLHIALQLSVEQQQITVQSSAQQNGLALEQSANAGALVLQGQDLESLPDDPDDLAADLKALAGPSAGPNGAEIFIDGFSGGHLPPKDSIREIRINQNPFSAEYDHVGFGRIEILTKPGSDKFRGIAFFKLSDAELNSRNPYSLTKPPYQSRQFGGNVSGPLHKRASFFFDFEQRDIGESAIINAITLDPALQIASLNLPVATPQRYSSLSPRIDYQLSANNTLTARYSFLDTSTNNAGVGRFSLASHGYDRSERENRLQVSETAVIHSKLINEVHFQYLHTGMHETGGDFSPTIQVAEAFTGGGSSFGHSSNTVDHYELQDNVSLVSGAHQIRAGVRLRDLSISDYSQRNFNGSFLFSGGLAPELDASNQVVVDASGAPVRVPITSIERYRRTLLFLQQGLSFTDIRALGGGASQFSVSSGAPLTAFQQFDSALFVQDEWHVKPRLLLSGGLRYETQNHIHDWTDFGPRIGFAWSPFSGRSGQTNTVIRGGSGIFYDRFGENLVLQTLRYNGVDQRELVVRNPKFFGDVPSIDRLERDHTSEIIRRTDGQLRAPYLIQSAIGVERQLPFKLTVTTTFLNSHALHLLRSRNITAPLDSTQNLNPTNVYAYESTGILNQNQIITNVARRFTGRMSLFGYYVYNRASSDTDGPNTFAANQYDLRQEYGRAAVDIRHRVVIGGSVLVPAGVTLSPFLVGRSGAPFNITSGVDRNADTLFTDRPGFASTSSGPGVVATRFGNFDTSPGVTTMIPRNYGQGPAFFTLNLRASRTFGFGEATRSKKKHKGPKHGGVPTAAVLDAGNVNMFHDSSTEHRYNVTLSVVARNVLNTVNAGLPSGNLTSPIFGQSNALASSSNTEGSYFGDNRRLQFQIRFGF